MNPRHARYMYAPAVPLAIALFCVQKWGNLPDAPVRAAWEREDGADALLLQHPNHVPILV